MDNFDLKKYLSEGRLYESFDTVTKDDWVKMDSDEREFALLSAFKDPEDAWKHIDKEWEDLPSVATSNMIAEGKLLKEEVSSRFIKKYLSMVEPENFKDIEDIESYSDRDKAIFLYLEIGPGIMVSDELARDLKDKPSEEIVQYFKDRNYSYMPYSAMDRIFGSITPTGMEFERGSPEKVHLDAYGHNRKINKILRDKYSDVIDFMKSDRTGGNAIEVHNAIQDRYSDEAKDGRSREVSYEEYASDFADAIRDRM